MVAHLDLVQARVKPVRLRHFCEAGVALGDIHLDFTSQLWQQLHIDCGFAWQAWHLSHSAARLDLVEARVTPVTPRHFCVADVTQTLIQGLFTWQAWQNLTSTVVQTGTG